MFLPLFLKRSEDSLENLNENDETVPEDYVIVEKEQMSVSELSIHNLHIADVNEILINELKNKPDLPIFTEKQKVWLFEILKNKKEIMENLSNDIDNIVSQSYGKDLMETPLLKEEHVPKIVYKVSRLKFDSNHYNKNMIWCISGLIIKNLTKHRNKTETKRFFEILESCILLLSEKQTERKLGWWVFCVKRN